MTQLGLNIFENSKIKCEKINDKKIKIELSNLNCLVENINNPHQRRQKLDGRIRQCTKSFTK